MRMKVKLVFDDAQREQVVFFAREIGMPVEEFCKRSVFYAINDAYRRAEEIANGAHNTETGDAGGDTSKAQSGGDATSNALPDEAAQGTT